MEFMEQMQSFAPIILMVVIFYFMLWRPQKKQQKRRQEMLNSMKTGAKVITIGGIYGTIVELHEDYAMLRIAEKTEVKITRQSISQVLGNETVVKPGSSSQATAIFIKGKTGYDK